MGEAANRAASYAIRSAGRTEARAVLIAAGELDLHDAVDGLQADAIRDGLVRAGRGCGAGNHGQGFRQESCGKRLRAAAICPGVRCLSRHDEQYVAPQVTVDAALLAAREHGPSRL
jgi:hypothetical protein